MVRSKGASGRSSSRCRPAADDSLGRLRMLQWASWYLLAALACMFFADGLLLLGLVRQVLLGRIVTHGLNSFQVLVAKASRDSRNERSSAYSMWDVGGRHDGALIGGAIASTQAIPADGYRAGLSGRRRRATAVFHVGHLPLVAARYPASPPGGGPGGVSRFRHRDVFQPQGLTGSYRFGGASSGQHCARGLQFRPKSDSS